MKKIIISINPEHVNNIINGTKNTNIAPRQPRKMSIN